MMYTAIVDSNLQIIVWGILSGGIVGLAMFLGFIWAIYRRKNKVAAHEILTIPRLAFTTGTLVVLLFLLLIPQYTLRIPSGDPSEQAFRGDVSVVGFPLTGPAPTGEAPALSGADLFGAPVDGVVTSSLLLAIVFLSMAAFYSIRIKKKMEMGLEREKMATTNALARDEALLKSIGEGVVAITPSGEVTVMSKVAENFLGYSRRELVGKSFSETVVLVDEEGNPVPQAEHPSALALMQHATSTSDYCYVRKDGTKFPAAITATPVLYGTKPGGAVIVFRDITKEKEIDKLRTDFLMLASHQLRTPLSGTKWLIETIQRGILGELNSRQKNYLGNLHMINERMTRLVSDMLNVLMIESGIVLLKYEKIILAELYEEMRLVMEPAAKGRGVMLHNTLRDKELFVESDREVLRNILESFIGNAISYSPYDGTVVLDAKKDGNEVLFSVKDSGIGIPVDEQKRVFERFYRASNAKEFKPEGTGLGLYIAQLLSQKICGKITFESGKNTGTTFYLRMPIHKEQLVINNT